MNSHMPHLTESDIAVTRAGRIVARASTARPPGDLDGWLLDALQRWWMMHHRLIPAAEVRDAFCAAVDATTPHLDCTVDGRRLLGRLVAGLRDSEPEIRYAMARTLMVHLGLDPEATVLSQHLTEWEFAVINAADDTDREVATYLAALTRRAVMLIADPEVHSDKREQVLEAATDALVAIAVLRTSRNDLWGVISAGLARFVGDDDMAHVARLACCAEALDVIATEE